MRRGASFLLRQHDAQRVISLTLKHVGPMALWGIASRGSKTCGFAWAVWHCLPCALRACMCTATILGITLGMAQHRCIIGRSKFFLSGPGLFIASSELSLFVRRWPLLQ